MIALRIAAIMRADTPSLSPDTPIRRAVAILVEARAAAAAVCDDDGALAGILTQKDCFRPTLQASYYQEWKGTVGDYMTTTLVTLPAISDLMTAADLGFMAKAFIDRNHEPGFDGPLPCGLHRRGSPGLQATRPGV